MTQQHMKNIPHTIQPNFSYLVTSLYNCDCAEIIAYTCALWHSVQSAQMSKKLKRVG